MFNLECITKLFTNAEDMKIKSRNVEHKKSLQYCSVFYFAISTTG